MNIEQIIGDFNRNVGNTVSGIINQTSGIFRQMSQAIVATDKVMWTGGFAGISEQGMHDLDSVIENYIIGCQDCVKQLNTEGISAEALKGPGIMEAVTAYINGVKDLLNAYIYTLNAEKKEMWNAYNNYKKAAQSIASSVSSDAQKIRDNASNIVKEIDQSGKTQQ